MKYLFLVVLSFGLFINAIYSQETDTIKPTKYFNGDQLIYEMNNNNWLNAPEGVKINDISLSSNFYLMFPLIGIHSHFSFAGGLGVSNGSIRSNATILDIDEYSFVVPFPDSVIFNHNKIVTTYIEMPLELRYMTLPNMKGRSFRIAIGGRVGYLIAEHFKYVGENPDGSGDFLKIKTYKVGNLMKYRYGVTARIGYGKFAITGYYSLSSFFEENKGPEIYPFTIGLSLILF